MKFYRFLNLNESLGGALKAVLLKAKLSCFFSCEGAYSDRRWRREMFYMYSNLHQSETQRHVQGARNRDLCPKFESCITFHWWSELKTIIVN